MIKIELEIEHPDYNGYFKVKKDGTIESNLFFHNILYEQKLIEEITQLITNVINILEERQNENTIQ